MSGEWREVRIGDLGRVVTGRTPPGNDPAYYGGDVPFLTPSDLADQRRVEDPARTLSTYGIAQLARCLVPDGVGVSCIGWQMGKAVLIDRPTITNQQINSIVVEPKIADARFVYYSLRNRRNELFGLGAGGSRTPILNKGDFERLRFVLPPVAEQRAIAHILGTLDDKIELNRRMNETLEAMARALFKSWFIDFDPVRRNAARARNQHSPAALGHPLPLGEGQGECVVESRAFDHLFPNSFEDSELGEIPRGWAVGRFGDLVDHLRDQENPLLSPDVLFHHFSIPAFDEGQTPRLEHGESIKSLKSRVPAGVVLLSKLNPEIERAWLVDVGSTDRSVCSTEFLVLSARPPFTRSFVYCLARSPFFRQQIEGLVTGTSKSHQRAQVKSILNLPVVVPPSSIVAAFDCTSEGLLVRTLESRRESRTLATLRDTLLPKLISGDLRFEHAEMFVGMGR